MLKLIVILLLVVQVISDCSIPVVHALWYQDIDSEPLNCTVSDRIELSDEVFRGKIQLFEDAFHFSIANQNIPTLCENSVIITSDLSVLQIRNCSLANIDPGAFNITPTLVLLKINHNPITTLKSGVFNSLKVKEIDVSNNFISVIEEEAFDNITTLEIVKLNYNQIKELNPNWFSNSPNVFKLTIIYNELTKIPSNAFQHLSKQRPLKLRISANLIKDIEEDAFINVGDIEILRMNGNKIRKLPETLFVNRTVKNLQVNTNNLRCFPSSLFNSNVKTVSFLENLHFNCSCLEQVKNLVETKKIEVWYPSIICEDREKEVNIVYNYNKTYEIPVLLPSTEDALLVPYNGAS